MTPPQSPPPKTILTAITQAAQTVRAKVDFSKLALKSGARVPELLIQMPEASQADTYPLVGERYLVGRSSQSCDIAVRSPAVSQIHFSVTRDNNKRGRVFVLKDENSTNGIYRGKKRLSSAVPLQHKAVYTLGPAELASSVRIQYIDPPPWYIQTVRYSLYGFTGLSALLFLWVGLEWQKVSVRPLPVSVQGPVQVLDDDGVPLLPPRTETHAELKRLSDFSPYLPQAVVASEDSRYYWHLGVDPLGIVRALVTNVRGGEIREGGSTLTQQLARSLFRDYVGTADSATRKLREMVVALKLETFYSKNFILRTYLNRVYLGVGLYGFEDASRFYFDKPAKDLSLSEAATLAGILPAPNAFNPVQDYQAAIDYRNRILNRMVTLGMVSAEDAQRARRSRIEISPKARRELSSTRAPYFYSYVFDELEALLGADLAQEGNFIVETSLGPQFQAAAEAALTQTIETTGITLDFSQGAVVTVDTRTGSIQALVGGSDYQASQFNRATQALRQPGSTFKVFAYAAALEDGIPPSRTYDCSPLDWAGQFFEGCRSGGGALDMYAGMARSENVVALRVAQEVTLNRVVEVARRLGIRSDLNPAPGLVLGESEVTPLEITGAFAVFANQGVYNQPHAINRILDSSDCQVPNDFQTCRVIYEFATDNPNVNIQALRPDVANGMTGLLQGVVQGGTGSNAFLGLGEAGKTGTTNDNRDLWFIGYVPSRETVTGVWLGNDEQAYTSGGSAQAAQLWGTYMSRALR